MTQPVAPGAAVQSGGAAPAGNAALRTLVVPAGKGLLTVTETLSTTAPLAGTVRFVQFTLLPLSTPPLSALTNVTFGSS